MIQSCKMLEASGICIVSSIQNFRKGFTLTQQASCESNRIDISTHQRLFR